MLQLDILAFGVLKLNKGRGVVMHLFLYFLNQALVDFVAINNAFIINACKIKPGGWVDGKSDVMN